ncbi:hypothetical protein HZ326_28545 [Fusarium oxysporum f. sp. albedinis]|nr:hypothetical protein HZ326_28545 [Fusarium oxysporum f. sp. albedinis]
MKELWELENGIRRLGLRNLSGKKPEWKWKKETSKLTRGLKGEQRPNTVVQEDKAPSHKHHAQQRIYDLHGAQRLLWGGNSPDLNAIEPAWPWIKRVTTKKGAPKSWVEAIRK